ncbi:MAG: SAM-dependent methyltransferase [Flavobacteriales bacterium]|nr:SAM-dependent methyltransferase [Flavobacteriales bacterium]
MISNGSGTLYLMPVWLGDHGGPEELPAVNCAHAARIDLWFAEQERTARRMLRRMVPTIDLQQQEIHRFDKESTAQNAVDLLQRMARGRDAGVISEAGMPGIADPGSLLVREAHRRGVTVMPLAGPNSMMMALAASGANGQRFTFHGYLPRTPQERKQSLRRIEADAMRLGGAELFMETPYRNDALLAEILEVCDQHTQLTIAVDLMQPGGSVSTRTVGQWNKARPLIGKRPAVFILARP